MPNLEAAALPGAMMGAHDLHGLDFSPTQTPAQTRSASPVRGQIVPHSAQQAADFVFKLNTIAEVVETNYASKAHVDHGNENAKKGPSADSDAFSAMNKSDTLTFATDINANTSVSKVTTLVTTPKNMECLTKVHAIDGSSGTSTASKIQILLIYFAFNLGLTLYNKAVMIQTFQFPFPFMLTALHAAASIIGTQIMLARGYFTLKHLSGQDNAMLSAFSVLYTANIAVSNMSL
ncbi:MAG: hypothetical protein Q9201_002959 [Fulgogasparrea decipioides]